LDKAGPHPNCRHKINAKSFVVETTKQQETNTKEGKLTNKNANAHRSLPPGSMQLFSLVVVRFQTVDDFDDLIDDFDDFDVLIDDFDDSDDLFGVFEMLDYTLCAVQFCWSLLFVLLCLYRFDEKSHLCLSDLLFQSSFFDVKVD
jgi:hypothetical protein